MIFSSPLLDIVISLLSHIIELFISHIATDTIAITILILHYWPLATYYVTFFIDITIDIDYIASLLRADATAGYASPLFRHLLATPLIFIEAIITLFILLAAAAIVLPPTERIYT